MFRSSPGFPVQIIFIFSLLADDLISKFKENVKINLGELLIKIHLERGRHSFI